jgi:carbon monoxide dehydrogenase subunit G
LISITEEIAVPSPPQRVWEVVSDPAAVVSCIGGAELGPSHDDGSFDGTLAVRFGGIRVKFAARVALDLDDLAHEGRLTARGADGQGATRFNAGATFRVVEGDTPGTSRVFCDGEIKLNGKLAKLIESGAGMVVTRMTKEFTEQLVQRCAGPTALHRAVDASAPRTTTPAVPAAATSVITPAAAPTAAPRPAGLIARLRAWWTARRARAHGQPAQDANRSMNDSGQALGQGGRR